MTGESGVPAHRTRLYLIRHGETHWNRLGLYQGTTDIPLNDAGRAQAEALGRRLRGTRFDAVYTSPLRRARETAEAVAGGRPLEPIELPELRELSYGLWQGRGAGAPAGGDAGLEWRWRSRPWAVRFPGGETLSEVEARAARALRRVRAAHPEGTVLLCGHGHLNRVLLIHALAWPRERFWEIEQANGALHVLELDDHTATLAEGPA